MSKNITSLIEKKNLPASEDADKNVFKTCHRTVCNILADAKVPSVFGKRSKNNLCRQMPHAVSFPMLKSL